MILQNEQIHRVLELAREGDPVARDEICRRYLWPLRAWTSGRLPGFARGNKFGEATDEIVVFALLQFLKRLHVFVPEGELSVFQYLKVSAMNRIRTLIRAKSWLPPELDDLSVQGPATPSEDLRTWRAAEAYESAFAKLSEREQKLMTALEFDLPLDRVAAELGFPTEGAARVARFRAIARLRELMQGHGDV